jgi:hypothetical protein
MKIAKFGRLVEGPAKPKVTIRNPITFVLGVGSEIWDGTCNFRTYMGKCTKVIRFKYKSYCGF